jgi:proline dehydrogenase
MEDVLRVAEKLNKEGFTAIINFLGEEAKSREQAQENVRIYIEILIQIHSRKLKARVFVKPLQLGLRISQEFYRHNLKEVGRHAFLFAIPLEIDMETEDTIKATIEETIYLKKYFTTKSFGEIDLRQALAMNFKKSLDYIFDLTQEGIRVRLCKGTYQGDFIDKNEIKGRFRSAASYLLRQKANPDFATHDLELLGQIFKLKNEWPAVCGFQFLLCLRKRTWKELAEKHERVAIHVPFGVNWLPYAKRRWKYLLKNSLSIILGN